MEPPELGQEPPSQDEHMPPWQFGQPPIEQRFMRQEVQPQLPRGWLQQ